MYLSDEQAARLKRLSAMEGRSEADLIRDALSRYPDPPPRRHVHAFEVADGPGDSVEGIPEEELLEGFGEENVQGR